MLSAGSSVNKRTRHANKPCANNANNKHKGEGVARIRTIKPEFWDSGDTARATLRARLLYIAMWNYADDYGIGDASPIRLIGFA